MCKWAECRPPIRECESLKMATDHSGGPRLVQGRKTSAEWRETTWRIGAQWGVCGGLDDVKPHSLLRCLFMPLARSPVLHLCSYSEQVGWVRQLLCSGLSLAISPFSSSSFWLSPFYFPHICLSICTISPDPSVHWLHWLGFRGEGMFERAVSCFRVVVDCCSVCALSVEVSHLLQ